MFQAQIEIPARLEPIFLPARGSAPYRGAYGGRGSGKSQTAALIAAIWGYAEPLRILCTRELQVSIKDSFHRELRDAISRIPWLAAHYEVGVDYLRGRNGTEFIFRGLRHNTSSIKSLAGIDLTIVEEAEDVPEPSWLDLEATVFRKDKSELWAIWNPRTEGSPVDKRLRKNCPANALVAQINWQDNPFFPSGLDVLRRRQMEMLDVATYAHIWDGAYLSNSDAQVFGGKIEVQDFKPNASDPSWNGPFFGADFGFSQDPTAAVEVWISGNSIYIHREAFRSGLELDDTASFVKAAIPGFDREVSRWDSSRPESISHLTRHGLPRATAVKKWPGSVEDGIAFLRSFKSIIIHPDCANMQQEARLYSYKVNDNGDVTTKIIDAHNHGWDAVRYAVAPMIKGNTGEVFGVL
jgi:phage terminase large subunit